MTMIMMPMVMMMPLLMLMMMARAIREESFCRGNCRIIARIRSRPSWSSLFQPQMALCCGKALWFCAFVGAVRILEALATSELCAHSRQLRLALSFGRENKREGERREAKKKRDAKS